MNLGVQMAITIDMLSIFYKQRCADLLTLLLPVSLLCLICCVEDVNLFLVLHIFDKMGKQPVHCCLPELASMDI